MDITLTLIGQVGTFLVFWWFVHKVIWPIFAKVAAERQQKIAEGLSLADSARHKMQSAQQESADLLEQTKAQANEILGRAQKQANEIVDAAREEAKKVGDLELNQARAQIQQEKNQVSRELQSKLSALVIEGAEKVIGREVNAKDHERLLQELAEKF
ncbi:F0F1 ATP synthase subunit B [Suttonella indologenes]|uniref:ATP synthase subunit b n=1 Tax=Suttonella indologenes TaxID=13276 RepID=A0A380MWP9_9GAMM|nr:F0F1 ATP synthase subunit B [Suttonella indologenes]SUO97005.1 F-type ATPase subunit b [Suttonella indologenes]